jgi:hypothetical protein
MPKREKRLTRKERQAQFGKGPTGQNKQPEQRHIHCISCGRHIDPDEFDRAPAAATWLTCAHSSRFPSCVGCRSDAQARLDEHDRTGQEPRIARAWH